MPLAIAPSRTTAGPDTAHPEDQHHPDQTAKPGRGPSGRVRRSDPGDGTDLVVAAPTGVGDRA
jgi:hypothetical protein